MAGKALSSKTEELRDSNKTQVSKFSVKFSVNISLKCISDCFTELRALGINPDASLSLEHIFLRIFFFF